MNSGGNGGGPRPYGLNGFLTAWTTVTRVPVPFAFNPTSDALPFHLVLVGHVVSVVVGVPLLALGPVEPMLAAFVLIALQYLMFNLFHLDGLLDTADALLCYASAERRREILKDSRIGVFAFFTGFLVLSAKLFLLVAVITLVSSGSRDWSVVVAVLAYPIVGRSAACLVPLVSRPAAAGLGATFAGSKRGAAALGLTVGIVSPVVQSAICGLLTGVGPAVATLPAVAIGSGLGSVLAGGVVARAYRRGIGGFTGDALGAAVELGELFYLIVIYMALIGWGAP